MSQFKEAREKVIRWLDGGGAPNEEVPLTYNYVWPLVEDGQACAGAAIANLMGMRDAHEVGEAFYGDRFTFFLLTCKDYGTTPKHLAKYLRETKSLED